MTIEEIKNRGFQYKDVCEYFDGYCSMPGSMKYVTNEDIKYYKIEQLAQAGANYQLMDAYFQHHRRGRKGVPEDRPKMLQDFFEKVKSVIPNTDDPDYKKKIEEIAGTVENFSFDLGQVNKRPKGFDFTFWGIKYRCDKNGIFKKSTGEKKA